MRKDRKDKPRRPDVDRLFSGLGLDPEAYRDTRAETQFEGLDDRWPLLGELRDTYKEEFASQPTAGDKPPGRKKAARKSGPQGLDDSWAPAAAASETVSPEYNPSISDFEAEQASENPARTAPVGDAEARPETSLADVFGTAASGENAVRRGPDSVDTQTGLTADRTDSGTATASDADHEQEQSEGEGPTLAEVFGLKDEELKAAAPSRRDHRRSAQVYEQPTLNWDELPAPSPGPQRRGAHGGAARKPGEGLQATFSRLRGAGLPAVHDNEEKPNLRDSLKRLNSKFRKEGRRDD